MLRKLALSFFLYIICINGESKECSLSGLPLGNVSTELHCKLNDQTLSINVESDLVPVNSRCTEPREQTVAWECANGIWRKSTISDLEYTLSLGSKTPHHREKRFWGFFIAAVACIFLCFGGGSSAPPPDRTPPQWNLCPSDQFLIGIPGQLYAYAEWAEPKAYDDRDGEVSVIRDGKPPQRHFENGTTVIRYTAKDSSGNMAPPCSFRIVADVIDCPKPSAVANGYYLCHPQNPFVLASVCRFGCYDGFDLDGPREITCLKTRSWSDRQPTCQPWTCPQLLPVPKAELRCTNSNYFRSVCTYICEIGYDMPNTTARALICALDRTWRRHGEPECLDVEPPVFQTCPSVIIEGADNGVASRPVTWDIPAVIDNSGSTVIPKVVRGNEPGALFNIGTHDIEYTAEDRNGNLARPCSFKLVVKEIRCQKLYKTPYMTISCPDGYKSGSSCTFICDTSKILEGPDAARCSKDPRGLFGSWDWGKSQPVCKAGKECAKLKPPKNGAVVCDIWSGGNFCQYQCMNGTIMLDTNWQQLLVCGDSGTWSFGLVKSSDCQKPSSGGRLIAKGSLLYYYDGNCSDSATQKLIKENFQKIIETDLWSSSSCSASTHCNVDNIEVRCGEVNRTRRDVQKRTQLEVLISVQLPDSQVSAYEADYNQVVAMFQHLQDTLTNTNMSTVVDNADLIFIGIQTKYMGIVCPAGTTTVPDMYACVNCSAGTFYDNVSRTCVPCEKGWYQDLTGQLYCKKCPDFTTTRSTGSVSCETACEPGYWSSDGVSPCSPCEAGTYQQSYGKVQCNRCPGSQTTLSLGATTPDLCHEFDIVFPAGHNKNCSLKLTTLMNISTFTLMMWIQSSLNGSGKVIRLMDGEKEILSLEIANDLKMSINGGLQIYSSNLHVPDERWHSVVLVKDNCSSTLHLDSELAVIQHICTDRIQIDALQLGDDVFVGSISQLNIWDSINVTRKMDRCFSESAGNLVPWHFFEEAEISGAYMALPSSCDDANECSSSPCVHGNCTDGFNTYACTCAKGFMGTLCDVNVYDCDINVCMNGATCVDDIAGYTCLCPSLYTGTFCEIEMVDGQWGAWSNWSDCSVTCDLGIQTRTRLCDNPSPDNGGNECSGERRETMACNETVCPVCKEIFPPSNGMLSCVNDTKNINCTVHCEIGYHSDIEPLDFYICGEETSYVWNFETAKNPHRRLPKCTAIQPANEVGFTLRYWYEELSCESGDANAVIKNVKERALKTVNDTTCINEDLCSLKEITILNCGEGRSKRETVGGTVGFTITITSSPASGNSDLIHHQLDTAYRSLVKAADTGNYTVMLNGTVYVLQNNGTEVSGSVTCPENLMRVNYFCIPCGEGSYLADGYCQLCGYGYYQDKQGQSSCIACSQDWTTEGLGSISVEDCTVHVVRDRQEQTKEIIIIACSVAAAVIVISVILVVILRRIFYRKNVSKVKPGMHEIFVSGTCGNVARLNYPSRDVHITQRGYTSTSIQTLSDLAI